MNQEGCTLPPDFCFLYWRLQNDPKIITLLSRHQSLQHVKMFHTSTKVFFFCLEFGFRVRLVLLLLVSVVASYCSYTVLQSYEGRAPPPHSAMLRCGGPDAQHKWARLRLNISRQSRLFLKAQDFFWREHMSDLALPYGSQGSEELLLKILSIINSKGAEDIAHLGCRTCVVVGNGFSMKNSSLGSLIDRHHVVIRLNNAPVRGYEEDVGRKTTMRFFYPESASSDPRRHNHPDTLMVLVPFKQQDLHWLKSIVNNEKRVRKGFWKLPPLIWLGDIGKVRVLDPHFLHQTARLLHIPLPSKKRKFRQPVHPTTGMVAVFVALNFCDVVHVAGFGYPSSKHQSHPIHYYGHDTLKLMKDSMHDINNEARTFKELEGLGAIDHLHPAV